MDCSVTRDLRYHEASEAEAQLAWEAIEEDFIPEVCRAFNPLRNLRDIRDDLTSHYESKGFDPTDSVLFNSITDVIEQIEAYLPEERK